MSRAMSFEERYANAVNRKGRAPLPDWAEDYEANAGGRFTWYVELRVRQDVDGKVSDLTMEDIDDRQRTRVVTVALLGVVRSGERAGQLRRLTRAEVARDFDRLLSAAIRRHGLIPAKGNPVKGVFRHKEG
jgi:hypothetical protein